MEDKEILETGKQNVNEGTFAEKKLFDIKVDLSFLIGLLFIGVGFYKLFAYKNSDLEGHVNAYVGGDAYNYIINAGQSIAYFVLSLIFVLLGCTFLICNQLSLNNNRE